MSSQTVAVAYGAVVHFTALVGLIVITITDHALAAATLPVISGLTGLGIGAGVALIPPSQPPMPSGGTGQPKGEGGATPAPQTEGQ